MQAKIIGLLKIMQWRGGFGYKRAFATVALLVLAGALLSGAPDKPSGVFGPRLCLPAQFWRTPGWQPREGDYAYVRVASQSPVASEIKRALEPVPEDARMVRCSTLDGMEQLLSGFAQEGFKTAALGYDLKESPSETVFHRGQVLAHRYGLKFVISIPRAYANEAERVAGSADALNIDFGEIGVDAIAAIAQQRRLYEKILVANPAIALFQDLPASGTESPRRTLRSYRGNADLPQGIAVNESQVSAWVGPLLRAIRPPVSALHAVAPNEGPSMYFFNFLWNTPGWQPREGDYAYVKIRPALKTLNDKVKYVMTELKDIPPERRKIMANGLAGIPELLHELIEVRHFPLAALDYDLEQWELTPQEEKSDPIAACKSGQALADRYHMAFVVVPDMPMSSAWGPKIAPFVAGIAPQCKGLQAKDIDEAIVRQRKLYAEIRRANPDVLLYHDLGASPKGVLQTVPGLLHYYTGVADLVDGIEIWSQDTPEQNAVISRYVIAVRPPSQGTDQPGARAR